MWSIFQLLDDDCCIGVLDIGASLTSVPPYQSLVDSGRAKVTAFEPDPAEFLRLQEHLLPPHRVVQAFLGSGKQGVYHQTNWAATGSIFEPNSRIMNHFSDWENLVRLEAKHSIQTTRLDDVPDIGNVDFIKIDTQGAELEILSNGITALNQAVVIQCEVSFIDGYVDQPLFGDLDHFLRSNGFQFHMIAGFGARRFNGFPEDLDLATEFHQQLWSDAFYVKNWDRLGQLSSHRLKKYAAIAHEILASYDLAYKILEEYDKRTGENLGQRYIRRHRLARNSRQSTLTDSVVVKGSPIQDALVLNAGDEIAYSVPSNLACISTYTLLEQECWFEHDLPFLSRCVTGGSSIIDIGSNIGLYALPLARTIGPSGRVYAFEPSSANRDFLEHSISLNHATNVRLFCCALSNFNGSGRMKESWSGELDCLVPSDQSPETGRQVEVRTLDSLANECSWGEIDFIKLDAEGQEARIIAGGRDFFRQQSPLIMFEVTTGSAEYPDVRWLFETMGYSTFRLLGDGTMLVPIGPNETADESLLNLFAAKTDRANSLAQKGLLVLEAVETCLTAQERQLAVGLMLSLPFANAFEIDLRDVDECPIGTALAAYSAYMFLPGLDANRRYSLLSQAFNELSAFCRTSSHPSALSSLARVALDMGFRKVAADVLKVICTTSLSTIDWPFFPATKRFDHLAPSGSLDVWFLSAAKEQFELCRAWSSQFLADLPRLESLCDSDYVTPEILRRTILVAMNHGVSRSKIQTYLHKLNATQTLNSAIWGRSADELFALMGA